ncbi:hypothetical protein KAJ27_22910 [bacterium]|nr:hypothetical protein [bacterium]
MNNVNSKLLQGYFILFLCLFIFTMWGVNLSSLSDIDVEVMAKKGKEYKGTVSKTTWTQKTVKVSPRPLLYFYLKELGYNVKLISSVPPVDQALMIIIDPQKKMFSNYKNRINSWVRSGGNLFIYTTKTHPLSKMLGVKVNSNKGEWSENKIYQVPEITDTMKIEARDYVMSIRDGASLIPIFDGDKHAASVLMTFRGEGKIILTSNPEFFDAPGLRKKDNLKFITRIIDRMSNQDTIYFFNMEPDQFITVKYKSSGGSAPAKYYKKKIKKKYLSFWSLIKANPISWVLLQMILGIVLYFYSSNHWFSRPISVEDPDKTKDNYLTGMSQLYMKSGFSKQVAQKLLNSFFDILKRKLLLPGNTSEEVVLNHLKVNYPEKISPLRKVVRNLDSFILGKKHDNEELLRCIIKLEKIRKELKLYG